MLCVIESRLMTICDASQNLEKLAQFLRYATHLKLNYDSYKSNEVDISNYFKVRLNSFSNLDNHLDFSFQNDSNLKSYFSFGSSSMSE
ncbi:hypothetical protein EUGRSUZ_A02092 [Eucalyptus grandis]|uniref:Uncharacterized protein n=2 Tax=Eucalyptus grandis TaxID=71139 RepID=A0ACC3M6K3_EUCGR|nr:hypothetical protein EUGRSUZ_A02092 [Eucalyptus grandis]